VWLRRLTIISAVIIAQTMLTATLTLLAIIIALATNIFTLTTNMLALRLDINNNRPLVWVSLKTTLRTFYELMFFCVAFWTRFKCHFFTPFIG
jgi:hypothetical protein